MSTIDDYLADPFTAKIELYEIEARNKTTDIVEVIRVTTGAVYTTEPSDSVPNIDYDDRVQSGLNFESAELADFRNSFNADIGHGVLTLIGIDGEYDYLDNYAFDGLKIIRKLGSANFAFADFRVTFTGTMSGADFSRNFVKFRVRGYEHILDIALNENTYAGTNSGATGDEGLPEDLKGKVKPITLGEVSNVPMVVSNVNAKRLQANDGTIEAFPTVYQKGLSTANFTPDLASGILTQTVGELGEYTADVHGDKTGGAYHDDAGNLFKHVLDNHSNLSSAILTDSASFAAFIAVNTQKIGLYYDSQTTLAKVRNDLFSSIAASAVFKKDGKIYPWQLATPSGVPVIELDTDNIEEIELVGEDLPINKVSVKYNRNHNVISGADVAGAVSDARRAFLSEEWRTAFAPTNSAQTDAIKADHPLSEEMNFQSALSGTTDAQAIAQLLFDYHSVKRQRLQITAFIPALDINVGDVVNVTFNRFNLSAGKLFRVFKWRERRSNKIIMQLRG